MSLQSEERLRILSQICTSDIILPGKKSRKSSNPVQSTWKMCVVHGSGDPLEQEKAMQFSLSSPRCTLRITPNGGTDMTGRRLSLLTTLDHLQPLGLAISSNIGEINGCFRPSRRDQCPVCDLKRLLSRATSVLSKWDLGKEIILQ